MSKVYIQDASYFVPGKAVTNHDMETLFKIREDWLDYYIGNKSRYYSVDLVNKKVNFLLSDLVANAAKKVIESARIDKNSIQALVMSTGTPDHLMPATVNIVADKLGINNIPTYQIQSGCSGAIQALSIGQSLILSGKVDNVLVMGGETTTRYFDFSKDFDKMKSNELINIALFGDGAGAVILSKNKIGKAIEINNILNELTGLGKKPAQQLNWYGAIPENLGSLTPKDIREKFPPMFENYKIIEKRVPEMAQEILACLKQQTGWDDSSIKYYLTPQLGTNMTKKIMKKLQITDDKAINVVNEIGNAANAMPFIQLAKVVHMMKTGDKSIGLAIESSKWIKSGFSLRKD